MLPHNYNADIIRNERVTSENIQDQDHLYHYLEKENIQLLDKIKTCQELIAYAASNNETKIN